MKDTGNKHRPGRRGFMRLCMGAFTIGQLGQAFGAKKSIKRYNRAELTDLHSAPILKQGLKVGQSYIFHYPYVTTPCFLIDLGAALEENLTLDTEDGSTYTWSGGVGPNRSIVAFSAICAHKMTHPAKSVSFINYRRDTINYQDKNKSIREGADLIYCCSERSVYDARRGAKVLGGPARQPLTTIVLEYDTSERKLYAVGTSGGEMYKRFFREFSPRLQLEYLTTDVSTLVTNTTEVVKNEQFSRTLMTC